MALTPADERTLIHPLFAGLQRAEGWETFLARLLPRTGAARVCLLQRPHGARGMHAFQREVHAGRGPAPPMLDLPALEALGMTPLAALRRDRVYALEELVDPAQPDLKAALDAQGIAHARIVRFAPGTEADAWLMLVHDRRDFTAADSALLSAVIPYLVVAITTLTQIMTLQLRADVAEEALAMLGVSQAVLDRAGRVVAGDGRAEALLPRPSELAAACAAMVAMPADSRTVIEGEDALLLRPVLPFGPAMPEVAAATALVRRVPKSNEAGMARIVAERFGLSAREASLAVALACGRPLVEAGRELRLTVETTRNYSKRIYAKTGARGQAALVRLLLSDLMPFA
jgi:DNA-binding CsgD family transcriptional regulator